MSRFFKNTVDENISLIDELKRWKDSIKTLKEVLSDTDFDDDYPDFSKKDIIDYVFDNGNLRTMSKTPREELRSELYYKFTH